jgi:hypothetical protein
MIPRSTTFVLTLAAITYILVGMIDATHSGVAASQQSDRRTIRAERGN